MIRKISGTIIVLTIVIWSVWDIIPFTNAESGDTLSEIILYYALRSFSIPFGIGIFCGHCLFPVKDAKQYPLILVYVGVAVISYDIIAHAFDIAVMQCPQAYPYVPFIIGIPVGILLCPQSRKD